MSTELFAPLWVYCEDEHDLARVLVNDLANLIRNAVAERDVCHLVFPGGRSPLRMLTLLREQALPWSALHVYPSDERCVPRGNIDRNDRIIDELLIDSSLLPCDNLHRIPGELGPEKAAQYYRQLLDRTPCFDVAILGVGEDGHTASLFPGSPSLDDQNSAIPIYLAPKLPMQRVSIGISRLRAARARWVMIQGLEKRHVVTRILQQDDMPVTRILPTSFFTHVA